MKIVTACETPDLDGVACMYAYSELINIQGEEANYFINGEPRTEVHIVCQKFNIKLNGIKSEDISNFSKFVLVDCNGLGYLYNKIKPDNIVEVIDHHSLSDSLASYTHMQRCQIDRIGAAATIVTERFKNSGVIPSRESAILLFYAIISNSINLKATITKQRDIDACKWLECLYDEKLCAQMAEKAHEKVVKEFNWETISKKTMSVYKEAIKMAKAEAKAKDKVKLESLAKNESLGTATMVNGVDTTITTDTSDKDIKVLHNPLKQKLVKQN